MRKLIWLGLFLITVGCGSANPLTGPSAVPPDAYGAVAQDPRIEAALARLTASQAPVPWADDRPLGAWWTSLGVTVRVSDDLQGAAGRQDGRTLWLLNPALLTYPADRDAVTAIAAVLIHEARHISFGPHRCKDLDYVSDGWSPFAAQAWYWQIAGRPDVADAIRTQSLCP